MVVESSLIGFLRTMIIIMAIYYSLMLIRKFVLPWIMRWALKRVGKKVNASFSADKRNFNTSTQGRTIRDDGAMKITVKDKKSKRDPDDLDSGEYVDFEEV